MRQSIEYRENDDNVYLFINIYKLYKSYY